LRTNENIEFDNLVLNDRKKMNKLSDFNPIFAGIKAAQIENKFIKKKKYNENIGQSLSKISDKSKIDNSIINVLFNSFRML